jgi:hypothetical protein
MAKETTESIYSNAWRLNDTLLKGQWVTEEIKVKFKGS